MRLTSEGNNFICDACKLFSDTVGTPIEASWNHKFFGSISVSDIVSDTDQYLGNCPATPSLTQQ